MFRVRLLQRCYGAVQIGPPGFLPSRHSTAARSWMAVKKFGSIARVWSYSRSASSYARLRRNPSDGHFLGTVTVTNTRGSTLQGPLSLVLDSLNNSTLYNAAGNTACLSPLSPYLLLNSGQSMAPGASTQVVVELTAISTYSTRVLSGLVR